MRHLARSPRCPGEARNDRLIRNGESYVTRALPALLLLLFGVPVISQPVTVSTPLERASGAGSRVAEEFLKEDRVCTAIPVGTHSVNCDSAAERPVLLQTRDSAQMKCVRYRAADLLTARIR